MGCCTLGKSPTGLGLFLNTPSPANNVSQVVIVVNDKWVVSGSQRGVLDISSYWCVRSWIRSESAARSVEKAIPYPWYFKLCYFSLDAPDYTGMLNTLALNVAR